MRSIVTEKKLVVILFVMVLITFTLAQEDSRKMAKIQSGLMIQTSDWRPAAQPKITSNPPENSKETTVITPAFAE